MAAAGLLGGCSGADDGRTTVTVAASAVGDEGRILAAQVARYTALRPDLRVVLRPVPDDATQRHQLYVQWLAARTDDPDLLQLDVVWTPEFAAAGWIAPVPGSVASPGDFVPAAIAANRWRDTLFAIPWFVDVGLLYRRTDLVPQVPESADALASMARAAMQDGAGTAARPEGGPRYGFVWQGARYEGLVTVFLEYLGATGGAIMRGDTVTVDEPAAIRALELMRTQLGPAGIAPRDVLGWHEEEARLAFQNGDAVFMRNWPYAYALLADSTRSAVAGRVAVSPMPAAAGGSRAAALGGAQLAVSRWSDVPGAAWELAAYLTAPERMLERAEAVGQLPARQSVFDDPRLAAALPMPVADARAAVAAALPRPVTPLWTELSEVLQVHLHRALAGQSAAAPALHAAAGEMRAVLERSGLAP